MVIEEKAKKNKERRTARKITTTLKNEGKYSDELGIQVNVTAQLMEYVEQLREEINRPEHKPVISSISREGNERLDVNPLDKLYLDCLEKLQLSLRRLGMNVDSKERKQGKDRLDEFLKGLDEE